MAHSKIHLKSNQEIDEMLGIEDHALAPEDSQNYDPKIFYTDGLTSSEALYTDYQDLLKMREILCELEVKSFCDLGAGIGRAKLLFDYLKSPFKSYSIEYVKERHLAGLMAHQKKSLPFSQGFINSDLSVKPAPTCDSYFIYLPVNDVLISIISFLEKKFTHKSCYLLAIESHGDLLSFLEKAHPFLKIIKKVPLKSKRHHDDLILYQWSPTAAFIKEKSALEKEINTIPSPLKITFTTQSQFWMLWKLLKDREHYQILVEDEQGLWLADLKDSQFGIQVDTIETKYPYRIIPLAEIRGFICPPKNWIGLIKERRLQRKGPLGEMRKLFVSPFPQVEYSWGQKRELENTWPWELLTTLGV